MELNEWSPRFDTLYNNLMSNQAPGVDEYEKSVLLTKAQEEIIKNHFNPKGNKYSEGYDDSPKRQMDFSMLTVVSKQDQVTNDSTLQHLHTGQNAKSSVSHFFNFPSDAFIILNEQLLVTRNGGEKYLMVVPIDRVTFDMKMSKPFKYPLKHQAWRLLTSTSSKRCAELVPGPNDTVNSYIIRYLRRPNPIILEDLPDGLTINGDSKAQNCSLDENLHEEILQRAVELAKIAYGGDINATQLAVTTGDRSE